MDGHVLIAGSGTMGCGIASISAMAGNQTVMYSASPEAVKAAPARVQANLDELVGQGLATGEQAREAMARISTRETLEEACEGAGLVIEATHENLAVKQALFQKLDALTPGDVLLLSNTSGLRITDIAARVKHPERALTAHFWLPANLVPLVEVVVGDRSDPENAAAAAEILKSWGKSPVIVKRDLPGQLANRILQAVIREAVNIVEIGLATPEDVDTAVKMGMALRFPVWGPLEHVDAVGLDICGPVQNTVLPEISARRDASPLFKRLMDEGSLGYKAGKGFYDWSRKDMQALLKRRNDFIVHALKKVRS